MKPRIKIEKGDKFNRLTFLKELPVVVRNKSRRRVLCRCDCGKKHEVYLDNLVRGCVKSCGCLHAEIRPFIRLTHGLSGSKEHRAWSAMRRRCYDPKDKSFNRYGGRGIAVCKRWSKFENFLEDMGTAPCRSSSVNRKNNDGNYTPANCAWASPKEQANNRSVSVYLKFKGVRKTSGEWGEELGLQRQTIEARLKRGWSIRRTLTTPLIEKYSVKRKAA